MHLVKQFFFYLRGLIPQHSLDISLSSTYNHALERFPDKIDTILQPETVGIPSWRRLRNTKDVLPGEDPRIASLKRELGITGPKALNDIDKTNLKLKSKIPADGNAKYVKVS